MPDIIISDQALAVFLIYLSIAGIFVTVSVIYDGIKWLVTRRSRKKYLTIINVTHKDPVVFNFGDESLKGKTHDT